MEQLVSFYMTLLNSALTSLLVFGSYGGFWLAYAAILIPGSGIGAAYAETPSQEPNAIGIFLAAWFM